MDRLLQADRDAFVRAMRAEVDQVLGRVMDEVNKAPDGNVINGSEMQVRDLMEELRQKAYQTAVQMRIDSHESTFSPSEGCGGKGPGEQGPVQPQHAHKQRADQLVEKALPWRGGRKPKSRGPAPGSK